MKEIIVRDPIHGFIHLDTFEFVKPLVDSPQFQRLKRLSQTGVSFVTYPSATHTRFAHSLGAYHIFRQLCERLLRLEQTKADEMQSLLELGCASALLHDVGHGPLSHVSEGAFRFKHEDLTRSIIDSGEVAEILDRFQIDRSKMKKILEGTVSGNLLLISQMISSQLDADRLDYLVRDAYFTGVGFGNIDLNRLINMFRIHHGEGKLKGYAISLNKGRYSIESYILTRHLMYQDVYYHKATRGAELLVRRALQRATELSQDTFKLPDELSFLAEDRPPTSSEILNLDDHVLISILSRWTKANDKILSNLCNRFINRNFLKTIELSSARVSKYLSEGLEDHLGQIASRNGFDPRYYCPIDNHSDTPYEPYSLGATSDEEESVVTSIFVYDEEGIPHEISRKSDVVNALSKTKYSDRLYVPSEIREEAESLFQEAD